MSKPIYTSQLLGKKGGKEGAMTQGGREGAIANLHNVFWSRTEQILGSEFPNCDNQTSLFFFPEVV